MKTKTFSILVILFLGISTFSCNNHQKIEPTVPYLDVSTTNKEFLSQADWLSIKEGAFRMHFYVEDGNLKSMVNNKEEINVSPELYSILIDIMNYVNEKRIFSCMIETKADDDNTPFDCVICALASWGDHSYETILEWDTANYGTDGIPTNQVNAVVQNFYPEAFGMHISYLTEDILNLIDFSESTTIGVFPSPSGIPGMGHMANISNYINGSFSIYDYQDSTSYSISLSDMLYVFYRPGADSCVVDIALNLFLK